MWHSARMDGLREVMRHTEHMSITHVDETDYTHVNGITHMWMRYITCVDELRVIVHIWMRHITHMDDLRDVMSHVAHMNETDYTHVNETYYMYGWVTWRHETCGTFEWDRLHTYEWDILHLWMSCESDYAYGWDVLHVWMRYVTTYVTTHESWRCDEGSWLMSRHVLMSDDSELRDDFIGIR